MAISLTELRPHIFRYIDQILKTGEPLYIKRNGKLLKVCLDDQTYFSLEQCLRKNHAITQGDPEELVHMSWDFEWAESKHIQGSEE